MYLKLKQREFQDMKKYTIISRDKRQLIYQGNDFESAKVFFNEAVRVIKYKGLNVEIDFFENTNLIASSSVNRKEVA